MKGVDERNRNQVIDAFRGIAVVSVMAFHFLVRWTPPFASQNLPGYQHTYPSLFGLGALGVHVFFVISGIVISMTVSKCATVLDFGIKRFARIYPAFLVAATITFLLMRLAGPKVFQVGVPDYLASLTMEAADLRRQFVDGAYWSLAVEVKFYLFTAIGLYFLRQRFWLFLLGVGVTGALAGLLKPHAADDLLLRCYMPLFIFGMATWLWLWAGKKRDAAISAALGIVLYAVNPPDYSAQLSGVVMPHLFVLGLSGVMIGLLAIMPHARFGGLAQIGRISYSLYLYHQFLGLTAITAMVRLGVPELAAMGMSALLMLAIAWISFVLVEEPGRKMISHAYKQRMPKPDPFPAEG